MLLRTQEFGVENAKMVDGALRRFSDSKTDFADCLIERSAQKAGCSYTPTFDERAARTAGMRLVP